MNLRWFAITAVIGVFASTSRANDDATIIAPYVDGQTIAVIRVDIANFDLPSHRKRVAELLPDAGEVKATLQKAESALAELKQCGVKVAYGIVSAEDMPTGMPLIIVIPIPAGVERKTAGEMTLKFTRALAFDCVANHRPTNLAATPIAAVVAPKAVMDRLPSAKPTARPDLTEALTAGQKRALQVIFAPTNDIRRVIEENLPTLPAQLGGGPITVFSRGTSWASLTLDIGNKLGINLSVRCTDGAAAKAQSDVFTSALAALSKQKIDDPTGRDLVNAVVKNVKPTVGVNGWQIRLSEDMLSDNVPKLADRMRESATRARSINNVKNIGLAIHNYESAHGHFPADVLDKDGKPLLSWRVQILPYLEQEALYRRFRLNEPWDSAHNKLLSETIPSVYISPAQKSAAGTTTYLSPAGAGMVFERRAKDKPMKFNAIVDGTSNTILIVETTDAKAVPWAKPDDWKPGDKDLAKDLIGHFTDGMVTGFADGSVRFIKKSLDDTTLKALLSFGGGEVVRIP